MDKVKSCIERIRVIRGVNYGLITNEQIQNVFELYQLDEGERQCVIELLKTNGIYPIAEEELPSRICGNDLARKCESRDAALSEAQISMEEETYEERIKKRFEEVLLICIHSISDKPGKIKQYEEEKPVFIKAIAEQNGNSNRKASRIVTNAAMKISRRRVQDIRKTGWTCGTYIIHAGNIYERWVRSILTEDELSDFIDSCSVNSELSPRHQEILLVLLHNIPKTPVNRYGIDE